MKASANSELYAGMLGSLEKETNGLLELFLERLEKSPHPSLVEDRVARLEAKCEGICLPAKHDEFALNEITVVADKLEEDLEEACQLLPNAHLHEKQEQWADGFEQLRADLLFLKAQLKGAIGAEKGKLFLARAKQCRQTIKKLNSMLHGKAGGKMHKRIAKMRQKVRALKSGAQEAASLAAKKKMAAQIEDRMAHLYALLAKSGHGRIIIDSKHMTVKSASGFVHDAIGIDELTHHALEGMLANTPLGARLGKLAGSNSSIAATFEAIPTPEGLKIKVVAGERVITGDAIVYKPHTFYLSAHA